MESVDEPNSRAPAQQDARVLIRGALDGDARAVRDLIDRLTPVVQVRVTRALLRRRASGGGRNVRQEVDDMTQEVFLSLFRDGGQALRAWDPARGLSLDSFVGMLAQHQVSSILRSGRANPWTDVPTEEAVLDGALPTEEAAIPDRLVASRELLDSLLVRLRSKLSPRGLMLFWRLLVRQDRIDDVCAETGLSADALYAWRSRLGRLARELALELAAESSPVAPGEQPAAPAAVRRGGLS